jgi:hypothetical protein
MLRYSIKMEHNCATLRLQVPGAIMPLPTPEPASQSGLGRKLSQYGGGYLQYGSALPASYPGYYTAAAYYATYELLQAEKALVRAGLEQLACLTA